MSSRRRLRRVEARRAEHRSYREAMGAICRCGKVRGQNRADAERKRTLAERRYGEANDVRFYACRFGGWHWTRDLDGSRFPQRRPRGFEAPRPRPFLTPEQQAWIDELAAGGPAGGPPLPPVRE